MHAVMRKTSANQKGTLFTTHLKVSEIPGKVAAVPILRKRNVLRSPDSECSTRGILISLRLSCSSCQLMMIYRYFTEPFERIMITWRLLRPNLPAKGNGSCDCRPKEPGTQGLGVQSPASSQWKRLTHLDFRIIVIAESRGCI